MLLEVLGFIAGAAAVACAVSAFLRYEGTRAVRSAYGRDGGRRSGNALIWPSR